MAGGTNWTRDETKMAFVLYFMLKPNEITPANPDIVALAEAIERTPGAVKAKVFNIGSHDKNRQEAGFKGLEHGSAYDETIWSEFYADPDSFLGEATDLLSVALATGPSDSSLSYAYDDLPPIGKEREVLVSQRINQHYFRSTLLHNYHGSCCLTGIEMLQLLVASHIKPWRDSDPKTERLAASNGLLLNAFHDRAFDKGFITIDKDYRVVVSPVVEHTSANDEWLFSFAGARISLPAIMPPDRRFIEYHNDVVFRRA